MKESMPIAQSFVNYMELALKSLSPNDITFVFVIVMILILFFPLQNKKRIIISIGIFGTFLGILIGLIQFQVHDITGSVPKLLEGLKISFITSVLGMLLSLGISIKESLLK